MSIFKIYQLTFARNSITSETCYTTARKSRCGRCTNSSYWITVTGSIWTCICETHIQTNQIVMSSNGFMKQGGCSTFVALQQCLSHYRKYS